MHLLYSSLFSNIPGLTKILPYHDLGLVSATNGTMPKAGDRGRGWFPQSDLEANLLGLQSCRSRAASRLCEHPQGLGQCLADSRLPMIKICTVATGANLTLFYPEARSHLFSLLWEQKTLCCPISLRGPQGRSHLGPLTIISSPLVKTSSVWVGLSSA